MGPLRRLDDREPGNYSERSQRAYCFHARDLRLVTGPAAPGTSVRFRVLIDGQTPGATRSVDEQGNSIVTEQRLYQLIRQPKPIAFRQFEIEFLDAGAEAYAFTFGKSKTVNSQTGGS